MDKFIRETFLLLSSCHIIYPVTDHQSCLLQKANRALPFQVFKEETERTKEHKSAFLFSLQLKNRQMFTFPASKLKEQLGGISGLKNTLQNLKFMQNHQFFYECIKPLIPFKGISQFQVLISCHNLFSQQCSSLPESFIDASIFFFNRLFFQKYKKLQQ